MWNVITLFCKIHLKGKVLEGTSHYHTSSLSILLSKPSCIHLLFCVSVHSCYLSHGGEHIILLRTRNCSCKFMACRIALLVRPFTAACVAALGLCFLSLCSYVGSCLRGLHAVELTALWLHSDWWHCLLCSTQSSINKTHNKQVCSQSCSKSL